MADYPERLALLVEMLAAIPNRADRIQMLIDIADRFQPVPESVATRPFPDSHRTPACESEAYVWAVPNDDGSVAFHFAVENPQGISAKCLAVILQDTLSGAPLEQVLKVPGDVPMRIFGGELSMGKNMGLMGMVSMVHNFAKKALARA